MHGLIQFRMTLRLTEQFVEHLGHDGLLRTRRSIPSLLHERRLALARIAAFRQRGRIARSPR